MRLLFPCLLHTVLLAIYLPNIFASSDLATVPGQELIRREFTGSYYNLELELYVPRSSSNDVKNADARKLCLTITELDDKLCFSHLSHAGSWSLEKSVTLGQMWFNSEKYRRQVFDQLGQTLASTAQTPWEHIDAAMRSLANSWHVFVNEDQVLQTFKTTPLMAEPRKIKLIEYVTKHNDKTGNLALQIGDMALTFTVPRTRAEDTIPQLVFSGYVYFRDRATMEQAVSEIHATVLELYPIKGSDSEGNPWQIPKWFSDIVTKEGLKVMPKYGLAWIQASKVIELLSERNSGCIDYKGPIKAMTQQTLEGFESERSETVVSLVKERKAQSLRKYQRNHG